MYSSLNNWETPVNNISGVTPYSTFFKVPSDNFVLIALELLMKNTSPVGVTMPPILDAPPLEGSPITVANPISLAVAAIKLAALKVTDEVII